MNEISNVFGQSTELIGDRLATWATVLVSNIPNLIVAVAVLFVFAYIGKLSARIVKSRMGKSKFNNDIMIQLAAKSLQIAVLFVGTFFALSIVNLDKTVVSLLAGLGVAGIALGFAFQDIASNFMSGLLLAIRSPFKTGDVIEVASVTGTVRSLRLRDTEVENFSGQTIYIPNKDVMGGNLTNYSMDRGRKMEIPVGISYEASIDEAQKVILEEIKKMDGILKDPEPTCHCDELGGSSVNLILRVWIHYPGTDVLQTKSELLKACKRALDRAEIGIPFPMRTLEFANLDQIKPHLASWEQSDNHVHEQTQ
ncbi:MAG TPA: mechanosensitive ion channel protein [Bdellovibrionales bacterium]|nr:mechanosensitive ion channel protein [Bdellovibrionales bacterium]|tara:strand:- start:451 stop:1380 length:930 start_codon:yes stop_codon:yes gene_type:complete